MQEGVNGDKKQMLELEDIKVRGQPKKKKQKMGHRKIRFLKKWRKHVRLT